MLNLVLIIAIAIVVATPLVVITTAMIVISLIMRLLHAALVVVRNLG